MKLVTQNSLHNLYIILYCMCTPAKNGQISSEFYKTIFTDLYFLVKQNRFLNIIHIAIL